MKLLKHKTIPSIKRLSAMTMLLAAVAGHAAESNHEQTVGKTNQEKRTPDFSVKANTSYYSNSSVGVDELDQNTQASDTGTYLNIKPELQWKISDHLSIAASHNFTSINYNDLDAFDLIIGDTALSAAVETPLGRLGYRYDDVNADLGSNKLLDMTMHTADWGRIFNDQIYWRIAYIEIDKNFSGLAERDAENTGIQSQWFIFSDDFKSNIVLSIKHSDENANLNALSNTAWEYVLGANKTFSLFSKVSAIKLNLKRSHSDYAAREVADEGALGLEDQEFFFRKDISSSASLEFETQFSKYIGANILLETQERKSNDEQVRYDRNSIRAGFTYAF